MKIQGSVIGEFNPLSPSHPDVTLAMRRTPSERHTDGKMAYKHSNVEVLEIVSARFGRLSNGALPLSSPFVNGGTVLGVTVTIYCHFIS